MIKTELKALKACFMFYDVMESLPYLINIFYQIKITSKNRFITSIHVYIICVLDANFISLFCLNTMDVPLNFREGFKE